MRKKINLDIKYHDKLKDITFTPIFILGIPRTGTTLLYKMLTLTKCFDYLTFYHIKYNNILIYNYINNKEETVKNKLKEDFEKRNISDRRIDKIEAKINSPEEYQFFLLDKTRKRKIDKNNISYFIELGKKMKFISNDNRPILFKSPVDFTNFIFIKKKFPDAKFIFTHRHPMDLLNSRRIGGKHLYENKVLYFSDLDEIYKRFVDNPILKRFMRSYYSERNMLGLLCDIKDITNSIKYFIENISKLDREDYLNVQYEKLIKHPNQTADEIMTFLSMKSKKDVDYNRMILPRNLSYLKNVYDIRCYFQKNIMDYYDMFNYQKI